MNKIIPKVLFIFIFLSFVLAVCNFAFLNAKTEVSKQGIIKIDGFSSDYISNDEDILSTLEPDDDSNWGQNEEIKAIYLTWDLKNLYIALDGISWGNGIIIYLQVGQDTVLADATKLNNWPRKVSFPSDFGPDLFIAAWDAQQPSLWKITKDQNGNVSTSEISSSKVELKSTINQSIAGTIEARIEWSILQDNIPSFRIDTQAVIKICAVLIAGDNQSGPDIAPDNSTGAPQDVSQYIYADNYISIPLDQNGDNQVDIGVSPRAIRSFKFSLPFSAPKEIISNLTVSPNPFSPNGDNNDDKLNISFTLNASSLIKIEIFDLRGEKIKTLLNNTYLTNQSYTYTWDGRTDDNTVAQTGIFILKITANNQRSFKRGIALIK